MLSSWELALNLFAVVVGGPALGVGIGRYLQKHSEVLREPFGVLQAALLGLVGLLLAFRLSLALGRYGGRACVRKPPASEAPCRGAETRAEPMRSRSLTLLKHYTDISIGLSKEIP